MFRLWIHYQMFALLQRSAQILCCSFGLRQSPRRRGTNATTTGSLPGPSRSTWSCRPSRRTWRSPRLPRSRGSRKDHRIGASKCLTSPRLDKLDPGFPQLQLDNHDSRIEQYTQSAVMEPIFLGVGIRKVRPLKGHMRIAAGVASGRNTTQWRQLRTAEARQAPW